MNPNADRCPRHPAGAPPGCLDCAFTAARAVAAAAIEPPDAERARRWARVAAARVTAMPAGPDETPAVLAAWANALLPAAAALILIGGWYAWDALAGAFIEPGSFWSLS